MVRAMISESIRAVISQSLIKKIEGGRIAAYEIMLGTAAIKNLIREDKVPQMYSTIQISNKQGMQTLDQHLLRLVNQGLIDLSEAKKYATNKNTFTEA